MEKGAEKEDRSEKKTSTEKTGPEKTRTEKTGPEKTKRGEGEGLERSKTSLDLLSGRRDLPTEPRIKQLDILRSNALQESSCQLLRSKSRSSWELSSSSSGETSNSNSSSNSWNSKNNSNPRINSWEGNSSGESSKSSSPEPESEFLRVFAQLRATRTLAA